MLTTLQTELSPTMKSLLVQLQSEFPIRTCGPNQGRCLVPRWDPTPEKEQAFYASFYSCVEQSPWAYCKAVSPDVAAQLLESELRSPA